MTVKDVDYCCIIYDISISEAIHLQKKCMLEHCGYIQQIHIQEINIKNRLYNYHFDNLVKAKKLETRSILIDEKNYKDLTINSTRYVHSKSIKMLSLHYLN